MSTAVRRIDELRQQLEARSLGRRSMLAPVVGSDRALTGGDEHRLLGRSAALAGEERLFGRATPGSGTGLSALDQVLGGGFPKGGIVLMTGLAGAGRMSLTARWLAAETRAQRPVAWVDAKGTLYPPALEQAGIDLRRLILVRGVGERALYAMEQILDSGAFGAVVGTGFDSYLGQAGLRRVQMATERAQATTLLILDPKAATSVQSAAMRLRVSRRSAGVQVEVEKARNGAVGRRAFVDLAA